MAERSRAPLPYGCVSGSRELTPLAAKPIRRAAALLEVVVSLSILLLAMGVVGGVFRNGQLTIERAEEMSRAQVMTERLLVEMDTGLLDMKELEQSGYFGEESIKDMSWRVEITPHEKIDKLLKVDVSIYLGDPDGAEEMRQLIMATRVLRPEPRGMDLQEDAGLDEDQIAQLTEAIPGGEGMFDPTNFDPRMLAQLPLDQLAELLPTLVQAFGLNISGAQLSGLIQALQQGDMGALQDMAQQVGGQVGGGAAVPPAGGGAPPGGGGDTSGRRGGAAGPSPTGGGGTRGGQGARGGQGTGGGQDRPPGGPRSGGAKQPEGGKK